MKTDRELMDLALECREKAYAPYSGFCVGAALLAEDGTVYTGSNVENASFAATCCAERAAFAKAVGEGRRRFRKIAIAGGRAGQTPEHFCMPCGICRQVMREFCTDDFEILVSESGALCRYTLGELLPGGFSGDALR